MVTKVLLGQKVRPAFCPHARQILIAFCMMVAVRIIMRMDDASGVLLLHGVLVVVVVVSV